MNTLYDLTKKIDSLTYNSQQVLNALIRSCIASGSSSGYRVKKYGQTIELTREDIYCLYTFYEEWKAAGFPEDSSSFYDLLGRADRMFSSTETPSTAAVVKHSKILYMTDLNAGDDDGKWLERIRESAAPAATVSTAPIPLNLRTPLYDENMSTKSFSQYETYLFPLGYQRNELMGTPGNGEDYVAGGRNWTIDASDTLMLSGRHIVAGSCRNPQNRKDNYGDSVPTLGWGTESYSFGDSAFVFGFHSLAVGDYSGATGDKSVTYGGGSLAMGGRGVRSVGAMSLATNRYTTATGDDSAAMNTNTVTGGYPYEFTFDTVVSEEEIVSTDCYYYFDSNSNQCVSTSAVQAAQQAASKNVLYIDQNQVNNSGLNGLDIKVGDSVYVYDLAYMKDGVTVSPVDDDGYANRRILANVTERTGNAANGYRIVLDRQIKAEDGKYGSLVGGKIVACVRDVKVYDASGAEVDTDRVELGYGSTSLNSYTIARGGKQTVAGKWNVPNDEASLVVGIGNEGTDGIPQRLNGLVVSDKYSYLRMPGSRATIGVSTGTFKTRDDMAEAGKFTLYKGVFMQTGDGTGKSTLLNMSSDGVNLTYRSGATVYGKMAFDTDGVSAQTNGSMRLTFNKLTMSGNTFGTLTATSDAKSFEMLNIGGAGGALTRMEYAQATGSSGFYYGKPDLTDAGNETQISGNPANWPAHTGSHIFNSTVDTDDGYETALMAIPDQLYHQGSREVRLYRPVVSVAHYNTVAGQLVEEAQTKELAYLDDVNKTADKVESLTESSRNSSGTFAHAGFDMVSGTGYNWDSTSVCMPGLACIDVSTGELPTQHHPSWKNYLHVFPSRFDDPSGMADGNWPVFAESLSICYDTARHTQVATASNLRYSLSGTTLSMSFKLRVLTKYPDDNTGAPLMGMAFPVRVGCEVDPINTKGLTEVTGIISETALHMYRMQGSIYKIVPISLEGDDFCYSTEVDGGNVTGIALSDGTVMLYIEPPGGEFERWGKAHGSDTFVDPHFNIYMVTLKGTVPFKAASNCIGESYAQNTEWANALKRQIVNEPHFSMYDWYGSPAPSVALMAQGMLNSLKREY